MSATNRGSERVEADFYPTPIITIEKFLSHHKLLEGLALEPSAGNGNFSQVIKNTYPNIQLDQVELREEEKETLLQFGNVHIGDFLTYQPNKKYTTIIGNPPYSMAMEFIEKCFSLVDTDQDYEIIMLLRTAFLESKRRYDFWQKHPLSKLYVLSERPRFYNNKSDATSYSFFVWSNKKEQEIKVIL